jgi:hypothetical protein
MEGPEREKIQRWLKDMVAASFSGPEQKQRLAQLQQLWE